MMRIIKQSERKQPRLSLILLDWGVRESFHLFHYLGDQTVPRDAFEIVVIEYYDTVSEPARKFESQIDTWVLLEMPADCYYHKHLMYNAGLVLSQGQVLLFGDSDAMVRPTFVETVLQTFERDPLIVYHMDEFRNVRRDFYPFNYPSFEDVLGDGCINNACGKTRGILDQIDPMHSRNYGSCMCARREDLIAIGGADEDLTYLGHVCGPYDMTFRLMNFGRRMQWETEEYLYHTWHPGSDGVDNYLGPHDGRNMSTTAFQALYSGRIPPLVENEAIRLLRTGSGARESGPELAGLLIDPNYAEAFNRSKLGSPVRRPVADASKPKNIFASYRGFDVYRIEGSFYGLPQDLNPEKAGWSEDERVISGASFTEIRDFVDAFEARLLETIGSCNICAMGTRFAVVPHDVGAINFQVRSHRENPRIIWTESLVEARAAANQVHTLVPRNVEREADAMPASACEPPLQMASASDLTQLTTEVKDLVNRVATVESNVSGIYRSRTWRTLTRIAGFFRSPATTLSTNGERPLEAPLPSELTRLTTEMADLAHRVAAMESSVREFIGAARRDH